MEQQTAAYDVAVIGAGPGGYATALRAAELGLTVALVERDAALGGTCLNRGCIPSKALITATHAIDTVRRSVELGVNAHLDGIDYGRLKAYREHTVSTMTQGLAALLAHRKVTVFRAAATFDARQTSPDGKHAVRLAPSPGQAAILRYDKADVPEDAGAALELAATHVVLSPGSRPRPLPGSPFHGALIDSTQALELDEFPSSAIVIGAGAVAVEFASMWNAAGVEVTLVIRKDRVLSAWDRRCGVTLTRELERQGVRVVKGAEVTRVDTGDNWGANVHVTGGDGDSVMSAQLALAAIGRDPATDGGWLEGVDVTDDGHIAVDPLGRTDVAGVWAVGDATAGHALAHRAFAQGMAVAEAIAGLDPKPVDEASVPQIVFSYPEAACVGLTGAQAKADPTWTDIKETAYPMMGNARMMMSGVNGALTVVTGVPAAADGAGQDGGQESGAVVLGVHMVCPSASDIIGEAQQLVGAHAPLSAAARLVHPHPTFSEALGEALLKADGRPLHTR